MAQRLDEVLEELGLSQYYDAFVGQGFDTWDTILDITESDLDALGVKLGHRRKLQRRIANFRGIAPDVALVSPTRATVEDAQRPEAVPKQDAPSFNLDGRSAVPGVLAKRKYRRHPKADESAPERPPSAYVLFSNKMREELKGKNLSFTEIAKLVGENWQGLSPAEREPFETQAQVAKDKYNYDLAEYKKTPEYKKYMVYLQEFKAKHSNQTQDKDAFKRIKLSDFGSPSHSSTAPSSVSPPAPAHHNLQSQQAMSATARGSRSGSESPHENDTPRPQASRKRRVGSTASVSESHYSASPTPGRMHSPAQNHASDNHSNRSPPSHPGSMSPREATSNESSRRTDNGNGGQVSLPSLSDMFDNRQLSPNGPPPPTTNAEMGGNYIGGSASASGGTSPGLPPHSMTASNSSASNGSSSSYSTNSFPRTPLEGSLPIHALLSGKPLSPTSPQSSSVPPLHHHRTSLPPRHSMSPKHSPPPSSWSYSQAPIDHQPTYKDHGVSTIMRPAGGGQYQFRS